MKLIKQIRTTFAVATAALLFSVSTPHASEAQTTSQFSLQNALLAVVINQAIQIQAGQATAEFCEEVEEFAAATPTNMLVACFQKNPPKELFQAAFSCRNIVTRLQKQYQKQCS